LIAGLAAVLVLIGALAVVAGLSWRNEGRARATAQSESARAVAAEGTAWGEELARLACEGPFASELWDEAALAPYLEGRAPQACR